MIRSFCATLLVVCLGCVLAASSRAEEPAAVEWVPFVAKWVQQDELQTLWGHLTVRVSGIYVRDKRGSWFRRATASPIRGGSPIAGYTDRGGLPIMVYTDTAGLCDRVSHTFYSLDFTRKTIKALQVDITAEPLLGDNPMSPQAFEQHRSEDRFLGKKIISGVECEGYAIHDSHHKGEYLSEAWYAPPLNYLVIEGKSRLQDGREVTTRVEKIQAGKEPDPKYFRLPKGFKMIK
jgi:hypothetical protein